jgi:hypothetical protein
VLERYQSRGIAVHHPMARPLTKREMMRLTGAILCACALASFHAGCAARPKHADVTARVQEEPEPEARTASALVFDPPVAAGQPPLELARADREPGAFVAYDEVFSTYFYLRMDDHQKISADGRSERRVISETFGISRR